MGSNAQKLYMLDASSGLDGSLPSSYVERRGLSFGAPDKIKLVKGIRPRIVGNAGQTVQISVGSQDDPYTEPTYTTMNHTIGTTIRDNGLVAGRYISIKFSTGTAYNWRLDSYDIAVDTIGEW